jgi:predicted transcriptional regulator
MARRKTPVATEGELEILQVYWAQPKSTVRDVHDELIKIRPVAQSTVATMIQIMEKKGLLKVVDPRRPAKYEAAVGQEETADGLVSVLVKRMFAGSPKKLIMHLLGKKVSAKQMQELDHLLDELK